MKVAKSGEKYLDYPGSVLPSLLASLLSAVILFAFCGGVITKSVAASVPSEAYRAEKAESLTVAQTEASTPVKEAPLSRSKSEAAVCEIAQSSNSAKAERLAAKEIGQPAEGSAEHEAESIPGTVLLQGTEDLASVMVEGIDRFLLRELAEAPARREAFWQNEVCPPEKRSKALAQLRGELRHILGVRDNLVPRPQLHVRVSVGNSGVVAASDRVDILEVRWPAFDDVWGEGILFQPRTQEPRAQVLIIPDVSPSPFGEPPAELGGLSQWEFETALRLAESGCRVLVPGIITREIRPYYSVKLSQREFVYRPAYELGRHIIGYELQRIISGLRALVALQIATQPAKPGPVGIIGTREGGMLALFLSVLAADSDRFFAREQLGTTPTSQTRAEGESPKSEDAAKAAIQVRAVLIRGFFGPRERMWQEPVDRNIFRFLKYFGCAELAVMAAPTALIIETTQGSPHTVSPGLGGAPGEARTPTVDEARAELDRATRLVAAWLEKPSWILVPTHQGEKAAMSEDALQRFWKALNIDLKLAEVPQPVRMLRQVTSFQEREERLIHELIRHNQWLLEESRFVRKEFMPILDTGRQHKVTLAEYASQMEGYRKKFYEEIIGRFETPLGPANPRTRKWMETSAWTAYEVLLDVFPPDVFAYGILLVPKGVLGGQRRPVVVCQHGLEGRPQQVITGAHPAYHDFAARLAERGFICFAPQNPYIFGDRFRTLQRKANPLGKTLFSIIIPQHCQIIRWLKTLPFVDEKRIAFYGLSYGGKTAMRVPAIVEDYCLSICSADFNEWVWKNAATNTRGRYSYVFTGEYEIFEFDLGSTFNYAEMAALIAPRPFMVERGHFDGVAPDEMVAYEFAKVRFLYAATLGLPDRCAIEWFVGAHTIHGVGTFEFLHRHLNWSNR